jgi:hypothetical protein
MELLVEVTETVTVVARMNEATRTSVRLIRRCGRFAATLASVHVAECGAEDDHHADQASKSDEREAEVRGREDGPGFHV